MKILTVLTLLSVGLQSAYSQIAPNAISGLDFPDASLEASCQGKWLAVNADAHGAKLKCDLQKLRGEATTDGMWINSVTDSFDCRFRIKATGISRGDGAIQRFTDKGAILSTASKASYSRPGLVEEYTVSVDGIRQDFRVDQEPVGTGTLNLHLELSGANAEISAQQLFLKPNGTDRRVVYGKLQVTDAAGQILPAKFETTSTGIAVNVDDTGAQYPVTVDPTFSDADWVEFTGSTGPDEQVRAMVSDGSGNLYLAGDFIRFGGMMVNRIVKWDGSRWSSLAGGVNGVIRCLAVSGTDLYAGGDFTEAGGISASHVAKWNGLGWQPLGKGTDKSVCAMTIMQGDLYAGGIFSKAGDTSVRLVAKWSGGTWSNIGGVSGTLVPVVWSMASSGDTLYVGGSFSYVYDENSPAYFPVGSIARYSQGSWSAMDYGMRVPDGSPIFSTPVIMSLTTSNGSLYAGGAFGGGGTQADEGSCRNIAKWDGSAWHPLGAGLSIGVQAISAHGSSIYAGGSGGLKCWNGSAWTDGPAGIGGGISAMATSSAGLHVGGNFTKASGSVADRYCRWDGTKWSLPGGGVSPNVHAVVKDGEAIYAAGSFVTAGGVEVQHVAKWTGSGWSALGVGMNGQVDALAMWRGRLYAGGDFTFAGGGAASNIAQWDGTSWTAVGVGLNAEVRTLTVWNDELYVGGYFNQSGDGSMMNSVAKWNGSTWSPLGSGMDGMVLSLAATDNGIYAGGTFSVAGGVPANMVAKWNGTSWLPLGEGIGGFSWFSRVNILCVGASGNLYAGGLFDTADNKPAINIAQWNGSSWSGFGTGAPDAEVRAMARSGNHLYVGGGFSGIQGQSLSGIACWDGIAWSPLGSGAGGGVNTLFRSDNRLLVGGSFTNAGNRGISGLAAITIPTPPLITSASGISTRVGESITYQITASNNPLSFSAQLTTALASSGPGIPGGGSPLPAGLVFDSVRGIISGAPSAAGSYQLLLTARNSAGAGTAILSLIVNAASPVASWTQAAGLTGKDAEPDAIPFNDGVPNLLKFAFNMNAAGPDCNVLKDGGLSGLPSIQLDESGAQPILCVQFLRRRNSGLIYVPERAASLDSFIPIIGQQTVTPINDEWERVTVIESSPPASAEKSGFARVRVNLP